MFFFKKINVWQHGCLANRVTDMMMLTWWVTPSSVSFGCYPSYCQFGVEYQIDSREKNKTKALENEAAVKWSSHGSRNWGGETLARTPPLVLYAGTAWDQHGNTKCIVAFTPPVRLCKQRQSCGDKLGQGQGLLKLQEPKSSNELMIDLCRAKDKAVIR